ncbi:hypothetical protein [Schinkia azotoformans]|uniref:hypothetical protein n=1 Tax=Schinkia azotoformans TaxID=1454 RepID=UPI002DB6451D|nr:hypothetical protein [Schinkia azotoformans]MEC1742256.1 hypothetical protein [Schinkia azotoformans]MEC1767515.1 hypothetical protein [Schinkia azotoformans]MEC1788607.1 hypothetical protein [Schinkia azotoformans]MED4419838.1 hypothetical protein [Schinkia azotoformans]
MSKKGSNREALLSIYLKDFFQWKNLLGFELTNIVLEQNHADKNIDLTAVDIRRKLGIYMEIQLTKANKHYLRRIQEMMNSYPESVIIWIAQSFDSMLLGELETWMTKNNKQYIDFYAMSISEEALKELHRLNQMFKLDIYDEMRGLDVINPLLQIEHKLINLHQNHCGNVAIEPETYDFSRPDNVKKMLLSVLNKRMPYYLNFHYRKKANLHDHVLTVGSGRSNISYRTSVKNAKSLAFVELYFDSSREDDFEEFKKIEKTIRQKVHPQIQVEDRRIGVYFQPLETFEETLEAIADLFEKFIQFFSPYIYGRKEIRRIDGQVEKTVGDTYHITLKRVDYSEAMFFDEPYETEESYRIKLEEQSEKIFRY